MAHIQQDRISLRNLRVSKLAGEESACFSATLLFDGAPVAEARNDGLDGWTYFRVLRGAQVRFMEAETFARSLPPEVIQLEDAQPPGQSLTISMTLSYLVEHIASEMYFEKTIRSLFKRAYRSELLFVRGDQLHVLEGVKLDALRNKTKYFQALRAKYGADITILAELPPEVAFALWKRYAIEGSG